jgi:hypothetical protein
VARAKLTAPLRAPVAAFVLKARVFAAFCARVARERSLSRKTESAVLATEELVRALFRSLNASAGRERRRVVNRCC